MNKEFANALAAREAAAHELEAAAHELTRASAAFESSSAAVLAAIPGIASAVGERAKARNSTQWVGDPAGTAVEAAQRVHSDRAAGHSAAAVVEHALCQAFSNGLARGSVAETLGTEFSTEAGAFLRAAADVASQRAPQTQPDNQFLTIIQAQSEHLRELTQELSR